MEVTQWWLELLQHWLWRSSEERLDLWHAIEKVIRSFSILHQNTYRIFLDNMTRPGNDKTLPFGAVFNGVGGGLIVTSGVVGYLRQRRRCPTSLVAGLSLGGRLVGIQLSLVGPKTTACVFGSLARVRHGHRRILYHDILVSQIGAHFTHRSDLPRFDTGIWVQSKESFGRRIRKQPRGNKRGSCHTKVEGIAV